MIQTSRRGVLRRCGVAVAVSVAGCAGGGNSGDERENDTAGITEIHGTLVAEAPSEDAIVDHDDDRIADDEVIQALIERATDPESRTETVTMSGGEFEQVCVDGNEFERERVSEAASTLEELPFVDDSPPGAYIRHPDPLVAVGYGGVDDA